MGSTRQAIPFQAGGVDRSTSSFRGNAGVYDLLNLRPLPGTYEQTDPLIQLSTLSTLDGEADSTTRFCDVVKNANGDAKYLVLNEETARYVDVTTPATQVEIPTVLQTAVPNRTDEYGECLLSGISALDFDGAATYFDVEIETAGTSSTPGTFQWRKDGGAWTTGATISTAGTTVGTGMKAHFLTTYGYTPGDRWTWTKGAYPYDGSSVNSKVAPQARTYKSDIYISPVDRHILRLRTDVLTSVGYKRIYGKYAAIFQNHLVIGQYAAGKYDAVEGVADGYDASTTPWTVGWSDLNDPDEFFSLPTATTTFDNEADTYEVPTTGFQDAGREGMTGMEIIRDRLYIYLSDSIYVMQYLGLPSVMRTTLLFDKIGSLFSNGVVATPSGHYFIGRRDVFFFDGVSQPRPIGIKIADKLFSELVPESDANYDRLFGTYNADRREVCWTYWQKLDTDVYQVRQLCYREDDDQWHFRNLPSEVRCVGRLYSKYEKQVFGGDQRILKDMETGEEDAAVVDDETVLGGSTRQTSPQIEWHDTGLGQDNHLKTVDKVYADFEWTSSNGAKLFLKSRDFLGDSVAWVHPDNAWSGDSPDQAFHFRTRSGKWFRARLEFPIGVKPVIGAKVNVLLYDVYGLDREAEG